jgi:hypothetical protein
VAGGVAVLTAEEVAAEWDTAVVVDHRGRGLREAGGSEDGEDGTETDGILHQVLLLAPQGA